jgi:hypothetical protein
MDKTPRKYMNLDRVEKFVTSLDDLSQIEQLVLMGIISGDGDIGSRMASSHPDAKPPVSDRRRKVLEKMAADYIKAELPPSFLGNIIKKRKLT